MGYALLKGEAAETAGGILMATSNENLDDLLDALEKRNVRHWEVGRIVEGNGEVYVSKEPKIIEV
jgi:selenide,water dikinase